MVRALFPRSPRRLAEALLLRRTSSRVLVRSASVGRACCCDRRSDRRRHQERRSRSVHASTKRQLARPGIRRLGNPSLSLYRSRSAPARKPTCCPRCSRCRARDRRLSLMRCPRGCSTGSSAGTPPVGEESAAVSERHPVIANRRSLKFRARAQAPGFPHLATGSSPTWKMNWRLPAHRKWYKSKALPQFALKQRLRPRSKREPSHWLSANQAPTRDPFNAPPALRRAPFSAVGADQGHQAQPCGGRADTRAAAARSAGALARPTITGARPES